MHKRCNHYKITAFNLIAFSISGFKWALIYPPLVPGFVYKKWQKYKSSFKMLKKCVWTRLIKCVPRRSLQCKENNVEGSVSRCKELYEMWMKKSDFRTNCAMQPRFATINGSPNIWVEKEIIILIALFFQTRESCYYE